MQNCNWVHILRKAESNTMVLHLSENTLNFELEVGKLCIKAEMGLFYRFYAHFDKDQDSDRYF